MKMFSKRTGKNAEQIEVHPQFKNYLYRYKLNNMLDGKKSTFEEFLSSPFKDNLTEAEAKKFIGVSYEDYATNFDCANNFTTDIDSLNKMLAIDYKTFLADNNLVKVDRATMSVGLEGREPMLDHRIIEFVSQLPAHLKIRNKINKYILINKTITIASTQARLQGRGGIIT